MTGFDDEQIDSIAAAQEAGDYPDEGPDDYAAYMADVAEKGYTGAADAAADWTPVADDDFPEWNTLDDFFEIVYQRRTALAEKEAARYEATRAEWQAKEAEMGKWMFEDEGQR